MKRSIFTFQKLAVGERRRKSPVRRFGALASAFAAASLVAGTAAAQAPAATAPRIIVDRFDPPPPSDLFFSVSQAAVPSDLRVDAALVLSYANRPFVLQQINEKGALTGHTSGDIVRDMAMMHILGSVQLFRRVLFDIDIPAALASGGDSTVKGFSLTKGPAFADIRLGTRVELLRQHGHWPAAALRLSVFAPTGDANAYTGMGFVRFTPELVLGTDTPRYAWTAMLGRQFQPESQIAPITIVGGQLVSPAIINGGQMIAGLAGAAKFEPFAITVEAFGATVADRDMPAFTRSTTNLETLLGIRYDHGPWRFGIAGGPGEISGVGNPWYRLLASVGFHWSPAPAPEPPPEPVKPPPKPPEAIPIEVAPKEPPKPAIPEPDSDGDGIPDAIDACPHEKGEATQDPKTNGCPPPALIVGDQIVILQQIEFATGSDVIQPQSFHILEKVASILASHPDIARLAIDGHTDSVGSLASNVILSQRRALSVTRWLHSHGVDPRRTEARGFGPKRPIAPNLTEAGRQKNRRVEFLIKKRTPLGEKGWIDGPVESTGGQESQDIRQIK